jgi:hypothetical protein
MFNLERFRGREIRVRFLVSTLQVGAALDYQQVLSWNPTPFDDGWFIDDVTITDVLTSPASVVPDDSSFTGTPCAACNDVTVSFSVDPASLDLPGEVVTLDAGGSAADHCPDGTLQFQFWVDDGDEILGNGSDQLLRDWLETPVFADAPPAGTTDYGVKVRCSSDPGCGSGIDTIIPVDVGCPSSGNLVVSFPETIRLDVAGDIVWDTPRVVDAIEGDLDLVRAAADFTGSVLSCLARGVETATVATPATTPPVGSVFYYLVRDADTDCNVFSSWGSSVPAPPTEHTEGDRDSEIGDCP